MGAKMAGSGDPSLDLEGGSSGEFALPTRRVVSRKKIQSPLDRCNTRTKEFDVDNGVCTEFLSVFGLRILAFDWYRNMRSISEKWKCYVTDLLVQCLRISDDVLLLDRLPKDPYAVDKLSDKAVELVNIIMVDQETEQITPVATYSAISLVHTIVQQVASKMEAVKNLEDFMKRLQELSSGSLPMQTMLQLDKIINILLETI
ncbi:hypothetical protein EJB05_39503 [Eragrostis curvula]|uniref:Uncharacterized protein n=1 Tax=Eragrostis curvula TaxID=38414 RepID=A0A5J9TYM5_9POAL|nr:hypothetical protein EJB05_39503 [Eragrostis curvula]